MDDCGAALRFAGLCPWIMYRSRTCRATVQSEAVESEAFVPYKKTVVGKKSEFC